MYIKLNESKVRMIRIMWRDNPEISINMMAKRFNVNRESISYAIKGKTWPGLPLHPSHPDRALKVRGYGDTNEKRIASSESIYPRGSVLAGGRR